jgi:hypothetical protein
MGTWELDVGLGNSGEHYSLIHIERLYHGNTASQTADCLTPENGGLVPLERASVKTERNDRAKTETRL